MEYGRTTRLRDALLTMFRFVHFRLIGTINVYRNKRMIEVTFQHLGMIKQFCSGGKQKVKGCVWFKWRQCSMSKSPFSCELSCADERDPVGVTINTFSLSCRSENRIGQHLE